MFCIVRFSSVSKVSLLASLLVSSFMVQAQTAGPVAAAEQKVSEQQSPTYHFPQWPQRKQVKKEMAPPPPPGPYMSTALSGNSIKAPSFSNQTKKRSMRFDSSNISMDTFSPDVPWPKNMTAPSPSRWMPDNGYQYVQPQAMKNRQQAAPAQVNPHHYNPRPSMNWSGMRFNPNSTNNYPDSGVSMPDMVWSNNHARGGNAAPSMGYSADRSQSQTRRPYQGNSNAYTPNRGPSRQAPRQAGMQ